MKAATHTVAVIMMLAMLPLSGCFLKKKKPQLPPPQAQAPTITVPIGPDRLPPETPTETTAPPVNEPTKPTATKPKPKHRSKKTATANAANNPPSTAPKAGGTASPGATITAKNNPKSSVAEGGSGESSVQISAEVPRDEAEQQRQSTNQLLESTEANLRRVGGRTLNDTDQATVRQIRNYITQSRLAMQDGDLERAYNLATKANLLCNEFVKRL